MKNVFIVKNPVSYLNVREWRRRFSSSDDENILICLYQKNNYYNKVERMESLIRMEHWDRVFWVGPYTYKSKKEFISKEEGKPTSKLVVFVASASVYLSQKVLKVLDLLRVHRIGGLIGRCDNVVFVKGVLSEQLAASVYPKKMYLTDTSKKILSFKVKGGYFEKDGSLGKVGEMVRGFLMMPLIEMKDVSVFSSYCAELQVRHELVAHAFSGISEDLKGNPQGDMWVLAGNPMCEYFGVSISSYIQTIAEGCRVLGLSSKSMVYAAHPGKESCSKLERLKSELDCAIDDEPLPLEVRLACYSHKPKAFVGFWSGSLTSLASMGVPDIDIVSLWHPQFDKFSYLRQWRRDIESGYRGKIRFLEVEGAPSIIDFDRYVINSDELSYFKDLVYRDGGS